MQGASLQNPRAFKWKEYGSGLCKRENHSKHFADRSRTYLTKIYFISIVVFIIYMIYCFCYNIAVIKGNV
jgi:hypothetical protein